MGMYTELALNVTLAEDTPPHIIETIQKMIEGKEFKPHPDIAGHPLFATQRWYWMLRSGGSSYFSGTIVQKFDLDDLFNRWSLLAWTNIKNYGDEWQKFLTLIEPHIYGDYFSHCGHIRYEEDEAPTLIYARRGKFLCQKVAAPAEVTSQFEGDDQ